MPNRTCRNCGCKNEVDATECEGCARPLGDEPDKLAESVGKAAIGLGAIILWIAGTAVTLFILYQFYSCSPLPGLL